MQNSEINKSPLTYYPIYRVKRNTEGICAPGMVKCFGVVESDSTTTHKRSMDSVIMYAESSHQ